MLALSNVLSGIGLEVVRFNFPYREKGSRRPDPMPVLMRSIASQVERLEGRNRVLLGGRSMGGRAASMLAAEGFACDGLMLFAYPLHPAGRLDKLRDAHLGRIPVPVLCFNGTRDALCDRTLMEKATSGLNGWTMRWLEGADHSFHVLKSSGRTDGAVLQEVAEEAARWLQSCMNVQYHPSSGGPHGP